MVRSISVGVTALASAQNHASSVTTLDGDPDQPLKSIDGQPPDLADLPVGCAFEARCSYRDTRCAEERPVLESIVGGRRAACFQSEDVLNQGRGAGPEKEAGS